MEFEKIGFDADSIKISDLKNYESRIIKTDVIQTGYFSKMAIVEATRMLRHALMNDNDLYNAIVASIESALRESTVVWEEWEYTEAAKKVADRIIGKESGD